MAKASVVAAELDLRVADDAERARARRRWTGRRARRPRTSASGKSWRESASEPAPRMASSARRPAAAPRARSASAFGVVATGRWSRAPAAGRRCRAGPAPRGRPGGARRAPAAPRCVLAVPVTEESGSSVRAPRRRCAAGLCSARSPAPRSEKQAADDDDEQAERGRPAQQPARRAGSGGGGCRRCLGVGEHPWSIVRAPLPAARAGGGRWRRGRVLGLPTGLPENGRVEEREGVREHAVVAQDAVGALREGRGGSCGNAAATAPRRAAEAPGTRRRAGSASGSGCRSAGR